MVKSKTILGRVTNRRSAITKSPMPMISSPADLCDVAQQLRTLVENLKNPEEIAKSIWTGSYWQLGPHSLAGTPGWWFRIYKPSLKLSASKLTIETKLRIKKTRGALQFSWKSKTKTFTVDIPPTHPFSKYRELIDNIASVLDYVTQYLCPGSQVQKPSRGQTHAKRRLRP